MESTRPRCGLLLFKFHDRRLFHWRDSHSLPTFVLSFSPHSLIREVPPFRRVTTACSQLLIMFGGCLLHPHFACRFMFEQNKLNLVTCHVSRPTKLKGSNLATDTKVQTTGWFQKSVLNLWRQYMQFGVCCFLLEQLHVPASECIIKRVKISHFPCPHTYL